MAGRYLAVEMQDESGDVIYPHTEADVVFTSDGKTVEENMSGDITEADIREMFNDIQPEMGSKLSVKEKIKKAFWHYMSLFKMQVLDSVEEIEANTDNGYIMGARAGAEIINNLTTLTDNGAIKGMDAREDGVYITYTNGADTVTKKLGDPTIKTQTISSGRLGNTGYTYTMVFNQLSKVSGIKNLSARGYSTPQIQEDSSCHVTIPNSNKVTITLPYGNSYYEYSCTAFEIVD